MSRHIVSIARPEPGETHAIVGYDRILNHYFVQFWGVAQGEAVVTREWEGRDLMRAVDVLEMPDALITLLLQEFVGMARTNTLRDWRSEC